MKVKLRIALFLLASILFTACGGGGGGGSQVGGGGSQDAPDLTPSRETVYTTDANKNLAAAKKVASSLPQFGSVTQSSNVNVSGVTTDAASTTFNGSDVSVTITRQDSSRLTLNSATDALPSYTYRTASSVVPGKTNFRADTLLSLNNKFGAGSRIFVFYDRSDSTDYLAAGYWLYTDWDLNNQLIKGVEVGAFADSPELVGTPSLPTTGTATYRGESAGLYATRYGSVIGNLQGTIEVGHFAAPLTLSVDFLNSTIGGCIGCGGSVQLTEIIAVTPNGDTYDVPLANVQVRLRMNSVNINSDGTFRGSGMTYETDTPGFITQSISGSWGGKFSTIQASDGAPRLVAGTGGADVRFTDGSETSFVGAFYGVKQ